MTNSRPRAEFGPQELSAIVSRYDLGAVHRVERQLRGSRRSPKVIITTDGGRFLLKRRAPGRDQALRVSYAHDVQQFLAGRQFPVPRLIPLKDGSDTMVFTEGHIYELFEYVSGVPYDRSLNATCDAGRTLGRFHTILHDFQHEWEPPRRGYHDSSAVRANLNEVPGSIGKDDSVAGRESELLATISTLFDIYESACERVKDGRFADWPLQVVHADWHPGNMLFQDGRVTAVIDYDSLRLLPPATDVANGALQFSIIGGSADPRLWPPELDEERLLGFLHGYDQEASLAPEQVRVLPWLMIEALIAEAVVPIAATGSFGRIEGFRFLNMISRKARWLQHNGERLVAVAQVG